MSEKTNQEILSEIAEKSNRIFNYKEEQYPLSVYRQIPRFKETAFMPNNSAETSYFVWSSDPYGKIGDYSVYCGAVIPINSGLKTRINIRKKNIIDKLNVFAGHKNISSLPDSFDSNVVIKGDDLSMLKSFFDNEILQRKILEVLSISDIISLSINEVDLNYVPGLNGKNHLSIINKLDWYMDQNQIEKLFGFIEEIRELLS